MPNPVLYPREFPPEVPPIRRLKAATSSTRGGLRASAPCTAADSTSPPAGPSAATAAAPASVPAALHTQPRSRPTSAVPGASQPVSQPSHPLCNHPRTGACVALSSEAALRLHIGASFDAGAKREADSVSQSNCSVLSGAHALRRLLHTEIPACTAAEVGATRQFPARQVVVTEKSKRRPLLPARPASAAAQTPPKPAPAPSPKHAPGRCASYLFVLYGR